MLRAALLALLAIALVPISSAFAEGQIELTSDQDTINPTDSIFVYGKISDVTDFKPLTITVYAPDGEIVFSPIVPFDDEGVFKRLIHPPLPSFKIGTYTITASHEDVPKSPSVQFTVVGDSLVNEKPFSPGTGNKGTVEGLEISATAVEGSDTITINGSVVVRNTDVTFSVYSPQGNLVSVGQVTPKANGEFTLTIKTGGPLWTEDGVYTITANQGIASEFEDSVEVEIVQGKVIPEFGTIAAMILVLSIISIIVFTSKSKLSLIPRI